MEVTRKRKRYHTTVKSANQITNTYSEIDRCTKRAILIENPTSLNNKLVVRVDNDGELQKIRC